MPAHRRDFLQSSLAASTLVAMGASTRPRRSSAARPAARRRRQGERPHPRRRPAARRQRRPEHGRPARARRLHRGTAGRSGCPRGSSTRSPRRSACTRRWGRWPSCSRTGRLAVVQGVGYPNPDRSHFRSMEIWETARLEHGALETGWLGRALDAAPAEARRRHPRPARRRPVPAAGPAGEADRGPLAREPGAVPAPARRRRRPPSAEVRDALDADRPARPRAATTPCSASSAGAR